jgi:hypothetical protein
VFLYGLPKHQQLRGERWHMEVPAGRSAAELNRPGASADIRAPYHVTEQFLRTAAARMIVAHELSLFAATGELKCRILW